MAASATPSFRKMIREFSCKICLELYRNSPYLNFSRFLFLSSSRFCSSEITLNAFPISLLRFAHKISKKRLQGAFLPCKLPKQAG
jgi:hypothetical protein